MQPASSRHVHRPAVPDTSRGAMPEHGTLPGSRPATGAEGAATLPACTPTPLRGDHEESTRGDGATPRSPGKRLSLTWVHFCREFTRK